MASKKALRWLASLDRDGLPAPILRKVHNTIELASFCAGQGDKTYSLCYQVIRMRVSTGDSKQTVGWTRTLADAKREAGALSDAQRVCGTRAEYTYYIRDIRDGRIYRA